MKQRKIKSYVLRAGRVSNRQQQGLDHWLVDYDISNAPTPWSFPTLFKRESDVIVEIGFGMGQSLFKMAQAQPTRDFIGIEVHQAGVGSLVADLHEHEIENVRVCTTDAVDVFERCIENNSLTGVQIFFPDPWPKKRHHKRRLIQSSFINLIANKVKPGGFIHCATDWQEYAEHMLDVLSHEPLLVNQEEKGGFAPRPESRPLTKFEQRGTRLGHGVWDLVFIRKT